MRRSTASWCGQALYLWPPCMRRRRHGRGGPITARPTHPDLAALHAAWDAFDACPLRATASSTVTPSGNPASGLVLLAEAPGPDDDRSGQAFSGAAGQIVDRVLGSAGLSRQDLLLAFMVPWRPPGGRPASDTEVALCLPFVQRLLALTAPKLVVLMGAGPLRWLAPEAGTLRQARGKWLELVVPGMAAPLPALPMVAPADWLKTPAGRQGCWADLMLLREALTRI